MNSPNTSTVDYHRRLFKGELLYWNLQKENAIAEYSNIPAASPKQVYIKSLVQECTNMVEYYHDLITLTDRLLKNLKDIQNEG